MGQTVGQVLCAVGIGVLSRPRIGLGKLRFFTIAVDYGLYNDGKPDVFWVDMEGVGRAFINRTPNNL